MKQALALMETRTKLLVGTVRGLWTWYLTYKSWCRLQMTNPALLLLDTVIPAWMTIQRSRKAVQWEVRMKRMEGPRLFIWHTDFLCRSQWQRGLRRWSAAACLLKLWVRLPPGACCECCMLSGRGLCDELITRPKGSYRLCCVVVCDLETSWMRRSWSTAGCRTKNKQIVLYPCGLFWPMSTSHVCGEVHRVILAGNIKVRGI
jgi:hypothetical protein